MFHYVYKITNLLNKKIYYESNKICQLNKEGEILHRWSALSDIKRSLNIDPDTISLFLRHKREGLYKGYKWVLESEL